MKKLQEAIKKAKSINEIENTDLIRALVKKRRDLLDKWIPVLENQSNIIQKWRKDKNMADFKSEITNALKGYASAIRESDRLSGTMDQLLKKMFQNRDARTIK